MRLFYVTSGVHSLSYLDPNIVEALQEIEQSDDSLQVDIFHTENESLENLYGKVLSFKPDVIIDLRGAIPKPKLQLLKRLHVPIGIWVVDDPYSIHTHLIKAKLYDFVITQDSGSCSMYHRHHKKCIHLPLAVNPKLYYPMEVPEDYQYDICFVGTALPIRVAIFDQLAPFLLKQNFIIIGRHWERLNHYHQLKHRIKNNPIPPDEVAKYYNGAKIVLNIHRTRNDMNRNPFNVPAYTPNNRTFDIAACKSFQLATHRKDVSQFYKLDDEIACVRDIKEFENKITFYLKHEGLRTKIAENAYKRTMADHTYVVRLKELIGRLQKEVVQGIA
jgi:spore maturation protein CgeB